jgi:hypothetical protein
MPIVPIEEINLLHNNVCQAVSEPKGPKKNNFLNQATETGLGRIV